MSAAYEGLGAAAAATFARTSSLEAIKYDNKQINKSSEDEERTNE